jgi:hypothetical protein
MKKVLIRRIKDSKTGNSSLVGVKSHLLNTGFDMFGWVSAKGLDAMGVSEGGELELEVNEIEQVQATNEKTGKPEFYKDGSPLMRLFFR